MSGGSGQGMQRVVKVATKRGHPMLMKFGAGALFLFCYVDVLAVLAIGDWISNVGRPLLYGGPIAFIAGFFAPAVLDAYLRKEWGKEGR